MTPGRDRDAWVCCADNFLLKQQGGGLQHLTSGHDQAHPGLSNVGLPYGWQVAPTPPAQPMDVKEQVTRRFPWQPLHLLEHTRGRAFRLIFPPGSACPAEGKKDLWRGLASNMQTVHCY